jgi:hypothetical protein
VTLLRRLGGKAALVYLAFVLPAVVVYSFAFDNGFRDDDFVFLRHSLQIDSVQEILVPSSDFAFYRPGAVLLFFLETRLFGVGNGGVYLVFNFLLHLSGSLLLVYLLRRLSFAPWAAALAGGLFVLGAGHYGKQVTWASAGGPLLAVLLVTVSLALGASEGKWRRAAVVGIWILAPAFHEVGLTAPALTVAWRAATGRSWKRFDLPAAALVVAVWVGVYFTIGSGYDSYKTLLWVLSRVPRMLFGYVGFMALPVQQSSDLMSQVVRGPAWVMDAVLLLSSVIRPAISALVVVAAAAAVWKGTSSVRFLFWWLFVALAPFCLVILPKGWLEPRYTYFAAMPFCALAAWLVEQRFSRAGKSLRALILAAIVAWSVMSIAVTRVLENKYDAESRDETNTGRYEQLRG